MSARRAIVRYSGFLKDYIDRCRLYGLKGCFDHVVHKISDRFWLWRLGSGMKEVQRINAEGFENELYHYHGTTYYRDFRNAMKGLQINPEKDVFIDYGTGIGMVVAMAAAYPFKRVIGVEISSELNTIAEEMIKRVDGKRRCGTIELVLEDAVHYKVPPDATVIYFYSPFSGEVLTGTLDNIRTSLIQSPRELTIIFKNPVHLDKMKNHSDWFTERRRFRCYLGHDCVIYEANLSAF